MKKIYAEINGPFSPEGYGIWADEKVEFETINFPAGEIQIRFPDGFSNNELYIFARIRSSDDIMKVLLLKEAFHSTGGKIVHLIAPYFCYSRQDRSQFSGDAFALKVFCNIIKSANFNSVTTVDQHSNVTEVLMGDNFKNIIPERSIKTFIEKVISQNPKEKQITLIAPDAGAVKRVEYLVKYFNNLYQNTKLSFNLAVALKNRDLKTGKVIGYRVLDELSNISIAVDDLADGGFSFISLSQSLKNRPKSLSLFVTHGIFSKGLELLEKEFDFLGVCATFYSEEDYKEKFPSKKLIVV